MPRKRRPTPPLPGSIVRNLAPKPSSEGTERSGHDSSTRPSSANSRRSTTTDSEPELLVCSVPGCRIAQCSLPTHINYSRQQRMSSSDQSGGSRPLASPPLAAMSNLNLQFGSGEDRQLPISDTPEGDYRRLFNQFFDEDFDQLMLILRPSTDCQAYKEAVHGLALQNKIYCMSVIASSHISNVTKARKDLGAYPNHLTELIYTTLLQSTRKQLESFDNGDIDVLLLAIVILCQYDLSLNRYDTLRSHHNGMRALVEKRGGVHNLGLSMPYVLRMDRFLAVRADELPVFTQPEIPASCIMPNTPTEPQVFGSAFRTGRHELIPEVLSLCSDTSACLILMDEIGISVNPPVMPKKPHPRTTYYLYLQENIEIRHCLLNYRFSKPGDSSNKNMLALTAARTVLFYVCSANFAPFVSETHATRLWNMLTTSPRKSNTPSMGERSGTSSEQVPVIEMREWADDIPFLLWLLFVCALPYASANDSRLSFAARLRQSPTSPVAPLPAQPPEQRGRSPTFPPTQSSHSIVSPSSPRRQRHLPNFILHVAEHLLGERPLTGTTNWDKLLIIHLQSFVWSPHRLELEFQSILSRVHERVVSRAENEA